MIKRPPKKENLPKNLFEEISNKYPEKITEYMDYYNTASTVLNGLVELGIFSKQKKGREWAFVMLDKGKIQNNWQS